ncbi:galactose-6-phosphate isomerase subunit LacB [Thalassospira sp. MA62]|uniref:Sugar-phosphate isomerase, RpiB/LacA/LacB family n=1 Tax=Exiguobacterium sp. (strain ATCC BAA-1283 / AT1b) TaxID=360911 RepID=C4L6E4_EXISA|nr:MULTISPECIES: galactose-6-phosphate isomerase subunit LacB [unclassified Exiguobacterium]ACQ69975.1 sugar-phosphate isomerase, RpiB/LacA/LacB family [Exiguobacterium sp. AT1b]MCC9622077.1 galactose-6-phosphate isomerase subunit LacB [Thalassospira sp. MA62]QUP87811.1 galactose-6-phosphate isomerase subunit LacB [Exiguobacterium sp. PFWT01]
MKIAIGCDHIVTDIKDEMVQYLEAQGHEVIDCGTYDFERTHYPIYGRRVAEQVVTNEAERGIVICGTGVGITTSANKVQGVRAPLVRDVTTAKMARKQLDANVIGIGGRITGLGLMQEIVDVFLSTPYVETEESKQLIASVDALASTSRGLDGDEIFDEFLEKWEAGCYVD